MFSLGNIKFSRNQMGELQKCLALRPGQVLKGQAVDIKGSHVVLQLGNRLITAESQVRLKQKERLILLVKEVEPGFIKLKILPDSQGTRPETFLLRRLGWSSGEKNLELLVGEMLRNNIPVSQESVDNLYKMVKKLKLTPELVRVALWLHSMGISLESEQDKQAALKFLDFLNGKYQDKDEARYFAFLNKTRAVIPEGNNIFAWPLGSHHLYIITSCNQEQRPTLHDCTLVMKIASESTGPLWFSIKCHFNRLNMTITCSADIYKTIIEQEVPTLEKELTRAGYIINKIPVVTGQAKNILDFIPDPPGVMSGINLTI
jgi:hypothetical protein